jgi:hypothetical protein
LDTGVSPNAELDKKEYQKFAKIYTEAREISFDTSAQRKEYADTFDTTPLAIAAAIGNTDLAHLLLEYGADINKTAGRLQRTPLIISIINGYPDIASLLLEKGADVNIADGEGRTALHASVYKMNDTIIDALIPLVENIDVEDNDGYTSLFLAFYAGKSNDENIPVILKLLIAGANIDKIAERNNSPETKTLVNRIKVLFNEVMYPDITAYFPAKVGYRWEYTGNSGKITDIMQCEETIDNGTLFYTYTLFLGTRTGDLYMFESNMVQKIVSINAFGRQQFYRPALTVVTAPGRQWQEEDRGDVFRCQSRKTSASFDGKTYEDCIVVEKAIYVGDNRLLMTKRQYFARGIGLVYVTLQDVDDAAEKPFLRLSSHNF